MKLQVKTSKVTTNVRTHCLGDLTLGSFCLLFKSIPSTSAILLVFCCFFFLLHVKECMRSGHCHGDQSFPSCQLMINTCPFFIWQGADISLSQHQQMIVWIGEMNRLFQFCPETFALGVCVLNRLLSTVKVNGCSLVYRGVHFVLSNYFHIWQQLKPN